MPRPERRPCGSRLPGQSFLLERRRLKNDIWMTFVIKLSFIENLLINRPVPQPV